LESKEIMTNIQIQTHATHCCKICGCKYGNVDCPVVEGTVEPVYECYDCIYTDYQGCGEYIRKIANLEQIIKEQEQTLEELKEKIKTSCN
jgi:hypothetical protein